MTRLNTLRMGGSVGISIPYQKWRPFISFRDIIHPLFPQKVECIARRTIPRKGSPKKKKNKKVINSKKNQNVHEPCSHKVGNKHRSGGNGYTTFPMKEIPSYAKFIRETYGLPSLFLRRRDRPE